MVDDLCRDLMLSASGEASDVELAYSHQYCWNYNGFPIPPFLHAVVVQFLFEILVGGFMMFLLFDGLCNDFGFIGDFREFIGRWPFDFVSLHGFCSFSTLLEVQLCL